MTLCWNKTVKISHVHFSFPVLEALDSDEVSGNCAEEQGYELNRRSETNDWGSEYDTRIRKQCVTSEWRPLCWPCLCTNFCYICHSVKTLSLDMHCTYVRTRPFHGVDISCTGITFADFSITDIWNLGRFLAFRFKVMFVLAKQCHLKCCTHMP